MSIRIGTWNVQYGVGADKNVRRLAVLDEQDADVWVLTETNDQLDLSDRYQPVHAARRYSPGNAGRWVTVWTRLPIVSTHATADVLRTVAVTVDAGSDGLVCVYGTVLPWQHDAGPDPLAPVPGWQEFYRVTPLQAREWALLQHSAPENMLVVAGDLNQSLGGPHYYGTTRGRALLRDMLGSASLTCLTETESFAVGVLDNPPIDHICAAPPAGRAIRAAVHGWNKTNADGVVLSDHSGVVASLFLL